MSGWFTFSLFKVVIFFLMVLDVVDFPSIPQFGKHLLSLTHLRALVRTSDEDSSLISLLSLDHNANSARLSKGAENQLLPQGTLPCPS